MADWRLAKALTRLRNQINALEPTRDKTSDGTIGDHAHQQTKSGHNPNKHGVVLAFDCTHDPVDGVDGNILQAALVESRDSRISFVIWNRGIWRAYAKPGIPAWTRASYTGKNPHDKHLHLELVDDDDGVAALYDLESPWALPADLSAAPGKTSVPTITLRMGDRNAGVLWIRERLMVHGIPNVLASNTDFTSGLAEAVKLFQTKQGLLADGVVGKDTRTALAAAPVLATVPAPPAPQPTPPSPSPTAKPVARRGWCDRSLDKFPF